MDINTLCSWIGRLNTVKMSVIFTLICGFKAVSIKIPSYFFVTVDKLIVKFMWKYKILRIAKTTLKMSNMVGRVIVPNLKINQKS